ncbi:hypothetical protein EON82_10190 [bacterium]|nr:MAG: hypothetical protein EON82_10190 [bacterium]
MYALLFLIGFFGFLGMAGLSFLHSGHDSHTGNHGSTGEAIGSLKAIQHGHARAGGHHGHHHGHAKVGAAKSAKSFKPWWAFSPFDIFAYCTGAGAAGELLRAHLSPQMTIAAAVIGAIVFNFGLAKPVLNTLLRFESRQSDGLEGSVAQEVEAITKFDANGRGLVRLCLDGQIVQVLAVLDPEETRRGVTVAKGDPLLVIDVDAARNTCRVTRELA